MRLVFLGAGEVTVRTASFLIKRGNEVVIVESNRDRIDELSEVLDCSFLHGDGSHPAILREVNPEQADVLFCLTNDDRVNLIASLVGRSLGFKRVIVRILDAEFETICRELGLEDIIIPSRTISRYLTDLVIGQDVPELSSVIKDEARFFYFVAQEDDQGNVADLHLPKDARVVCYYRDKQFFLAREDTKIRKGDEIVILTHSKNLPVLQKRWAPKLANSKGGPGSR